MADRSEPTEPTDDQIAMARLTRGPASRGDTCCSDCGRDVPVGEALFWTEPPYEYPMEGCDPYCGKCCAAAGDSMTMICDALESGELQP